MKHFNLFSIFFLAFILNGYIFCQTKKALITGVTGQDGSYLAELLLEKGYEVHGIVRRSSVSNVERINHISRLIKKNKWNAFVLHYSDITDASSILRIIQTIEPDEIYNLAAQSHVGISFDIPKNTTEINAISTINILEAIKNSGLTKKTKFYQASTSELYGKICEIPQIETTPFYPRSPYAISKLCSYWTTVNYKEAYGIFACNGILFNHESPRRGEEFVTRKVTKAVAAIKQGSSEILKLGNLDAKRDWGYAKDYVEAMWLILQQDKPDDYVIATGETHSVREFIELAFNEIDIDIVWQGSGIDEVGIDKNTGHILVKIDPKYFRPTEVDFLLGGNQKANKILGWYPKTSFKELVKLMVLSDCKNFNKHKIDYVTD